MYLVIDTSYSTRGNLIDMAQQAAKMVIDTLTAVDFVTIVRYSDTASAYSSKPVRATDTTKLALKKWIDDNIVAFLDAFGRARDKIPNFIDAFETAFAVIDMGPGTFFWGSNCNRIMLFLSGGAPDEWRASHTEWIRSKAALYSPPMHVLTYGLGSGAQAETLKEIACAGNGIYYSVTADTLANTMASYFQVWIARLDR